MEKFAITYFFDEIFPNFETWKEFSHQLSCIGNEPSAEIDAFDHYCYNVLYRQFAKQNVRYDSVELFLNALANVYEQKFDNFKREKEMVDKIFNLTMDEITTLQSSIMNMANNPNDQPDDPLQPLNYISAQTYNNIKDNKLQAYIKALNNIPNLNIERFIYGERADPNNRKHMNFIDLFMQILPKQIEIYEEREI